MKAIVKKDTVTSINATKVGSPSLSDFVASGFSTSNYYKVTGGATVSASALTSFEIVCKITTPSSWTSNGRVINPTNGSDSTTAPYIEIEQSNVQLQFYNGSSYISFKALQNPASNTTYWFKWVYDGSTVKSYYSTNGSSYTLNATTTPSYKPFFNSNEFSIGCRSHDSAPVCVWNGSVDLSELKITLNGSLWLSGTRTEIVDKYFAPKVKRIVQKANVTCHNITPSDDFVLSGFSGTNNAVLPSDFAPSSNPWEVVFKVTTGSNVTTAQQIIGGTTSNYGALELGITTKSKFTIWLGSTSANGIANGTTGTYTVLANTTYWVKVAFSGSAYTVSYSLNGKDFTTDITINSTATIGASGKSIGADRKENDSAFLGSVDLKGCYININGQRWWSGVKDVQVDRYLMAR